MTLPLRTYITHSNLLYHLVRPARGGAAGVVIVFSFLLFIASKAGLLGIPLAAVVLSWFFKYAYILFDHTVRGFDEPPTLDIQMVNPLSEMRPLAQVLILGLIFFAVQLTREYLGVPTAFALALICAFFLPASVGVLGLDSHIFKALNPLAWFHLVRGLGLLYAAVLLVIMGYAAALDLLSILGVWLPIELAVWMFAVLSIFSFLGGAIYERRDALNLVTWASPERTDDLKSKEQRREDEAMVLEAYGSMRANNHIRSWQLMAAWLKSRGDQSEDYAWLCERTASWDDPRFITRLTEERVARLLALKRTGEALDVVSRRLGADPSFRPKSAADTLTMAQLAARGGGMPRVARTLLSDFAARFEGDPRVAIAFALAQHLSSHAPAKL